MDWLNGALKAVCVRVYARRQLWPPQGQFRLPVRSTSCHPSNSTAQPWNDLAGGSKSGTQHGVNDAHPQHPQNPKENVDTTPTRATQQRHTQDGENDKNAISVIQKSFGFISLSILLLLPSFIFNGDGGTDGESSYPAAPLPHLPPSLMFVS